MKYRLTFTRKGSALKAGQAGRRFAIEVTARNAAEARQIASDQANREGRGLSYFDITEVRKI